MLGSRDATRKAVNWQTFAGPPSLHPTHYVPLTILNFKDRNGWSVRVDAAGIFLTWPEKPVEQTYNIYVRGPPYTLPHVVMPLNCPL